jgi:hypothetical protein
MAMVTCRLRKRALCEMHTSVTASKNGSIGMVQQCTDKGERHYLVISHDSDGVTRFYDIP